MFWRFIDNRLNELNMTRNMMAYRFKYKGNRYKIPMEHPIWWIVTILGIVLGVAIMWAFIVEMILVGDMFGLN